MKLSVIVPFHNAGEHLKTCLQALAAGRRVPDEIIVVDDGSTDESARIAWQSGAQVLTLGQVAQGPALARNLGASQARSDILVFLDADVAVHEDTLARIETYFGQEPTLAALFGSYDDDPPAPNLISRYYNLRHHWTHQQSAREAWTFWSGCGAVRREVFQEQGGFDEGYLRPSVEDIAFGRQLKRAGHRIWLCADVQATHLKRWTLKSWLRTDIWSRAVPWTQMLLQESEKLPTDLNLDAKSRLSAVAVWAFLLLLLAGFWSPPVWAGAAIALFIALVCNWPLLRFFAVRGGLFFSLGAGLCHGLYYLYSSVTFAALTLDHILRFDKTGWRRLALPCLLAATALNGLAWSLIVPPWQTPDEPQHFLYAHEIGRQRTTSLRPSPWVPLDLVQLSNLAPYDRAAAGAPFDFSNRTAINAALAQLDKPGAAYFNDERRQIVVVPNFVRFHPPGYYAVLATVQKPWQGASIRWRLLVARWLSVLFGVLTVVLVVAIGREIWPARFGWALLLGSVVAFQPMNVFTSASVNNDSPLILAFTLTLYLGLRVLRSGLSLGRVVVLALVLTAGMLVKMSFVCALPLLGALMVWRLRRQWRLAQRRRSLPLGALAGWLFVFALPLALGGPWYAQALSRGSTALVNTSFTNIQDVPDVAGAVKAAPLVWKTSWESKLRSGFSRWPVISDLVMYTRVGTSYWGNFGWVNVRVPSVVWFSLLMATLVGSAAALRRMLRANRASDDHALATRRQRRALWWLAGGTLALMIFYGLVDLKTRLASGGAFGLRGGYYLPAIAGQMAWLLLGAGLGRQRSLRLGWLLAGAMVVLNGYCLYNVIGGRYYGTNSWLGVWRGAAVLSPVPLLALSLIAGVALLSSGLWLLCLWAVLKSEDEKVANSAVRPIAGAAFPAWRI